MFQIIYIFRENVDNLIQASLYFLSGPNDYKLYM